MSNLFVRFQRLLPSNPLRVGNVVSVSGTSVLVQEDGGAQVRVIGEATVNSRVYFRAGEIVGPAPNLTLITVEE